MNAMPLQEKAPWTTKLARLGWRLALLAALGLAIGWTLNRAEAAFERRAEPAGFLHGVIQGALMPIAMPNLFFGNDVAIYSASNTGRTYKLGYTMGVNGAGLIFFGFFFWRLRRLRRRQRQN
jgi:hypothetical protein